ncbi:MAG: hypothetical protein COB50_01575 [Thiotrichales bacterium]|nr:MAG: hypothetical protein COB50_01575 [Thiotrichales bacterium]
MKTNPEDREIARCATILLNLSKQKKKRKYNSTVTTNDFNEFNKRVKYSAGKFLSIRRINDKSKAPKVAKQWSEALISKSHNHIEIVNISFRSQLTGKGAITNSPLLKKARKKNKSLRNTIVIVYNNKKVFSTQASGYNVGNELIFGLRDYNYIAKFLKEIANHDAIKEQELAALMLRSMQQNKPITAGNLSHINDNLPKKRMSVLTRQINRLNYLYNMLEVTRRPKQNSNNNNFLSQEMCLMASAMTMILLAKGNIRFADVLTNDARYGYFVAKGISKIARTCPQKLHYKMVDINDIFMKTFFNIQYNIAQRVGKTIIPSSEQMHQILRQYTGDKKQETPNKMYRTPKDTGKKYKVNQTYFMKPTRLFQ